MPRWASSSSCGPIRRWTITAAAAPNADTLYTMVWLDVSNEPWVFSIPDMGDRFYIMPMLSRYNEVFFVAGTRATGGECPGVRGYRAWAGRGRFPRA